MPNQLFCVHGKRKYQKVHHINIEKNTRKFLYTKIEIY